MAFVDFTHGDILEGGYDLTVFPCSAKGSVKESTKNKIVSLQVPMPKVSTLGDVSDIFKVTDPNSRTKYVAYGASVLNNYSSEKAIKAISRRLGEITVENPEITNIEVPLLGTGAGKLIDEVSAKALRDGFLETARNDARLTVLMYGTERLEKVKAFLENPLYSNRYNMSAPAGLSQPLKNFHEDTKGCKTAFIIMSFDDRDPHNKIVAEIKKTCSRNNILAFRADDKQYADGLLDNVLTYIYGCDFGIAVFDRIHTDVYNPNVSFEAGYLMGLNKPILLLKDADLKALPTDLVGNLYKSFNVWDLAGTLPKQINAWLKDKQIISDVCS